MTEQNYVRVYDFREPPRLDTARAAAIEAMQSTFAAGVRSLLTPKMREVVDAELAGIELLTPTAAVVAISDAGSRYQVELNDPRRSDVILAIAPELATRLVDRLCGAPEDIAGARALSAIEQRLLNELVERFVPIVRDAFAGLADVKPANPRLIHAAPPLLGAPGDHVVLIRFTVRSGPVSGLLLLEFPLALLEVAPAPATDEAPTHATLLEQHLLGVTVPVRVCIEFQTAALDIASLREGGILRTGHPCTSPVDVTASGRRQFTGTLGREHGHVGVRIIRTASPDDPTSRPHRRTSR
jgi:flagellar motor switch protein FliM